MFLKTGIKPGLSFTGSGNREDWQIPIAPVMNTYIHQRPIL
jgi:hypothetical protein